ncbi:matrixin family metalloprotease [Fulvivirgaceae bacterium BMA12]|uniref:Matrixin family metalloprotease n=1 Tax=Agaribacillus aureus TaxID=3051825 RepID=A0ABT8LGI8_9BACT|nr:matrixin family metalloprotease [Fulvivirgaceae bacterium BMA12]
MTYRILLAFIIIYRIFLHNSAAQTINLSIVTLGDTEPKHLEIIKDSLQRFYNCKVINSYSLEISPELTSKSSKEDQLYNFEVLNAMAVNRRLNEFNKDTGGLIVGITDYALTIGERFSSTYYLIRGLANDSLGTATISTFRIKNESENDKDFVANLAKIAKHELGHLLGMPHCGSDSCLMVDGYRFNKMSRNYCKDCLNKIDPRHLIIE